MSVEAQRWWEDGELDRARWSEIVQPVLDRAHLARDRGRFPQTILLVGPKGLGRELAAVRLAAMLTCPERGDPWCECSSCLRVARGQHPDVVGVFRRLTDDGKRLKKYICVDWARDIVEGSPSRPYEGLKRVWILSGAEPADLGNEAANALLKVLEEPPPHVVFILLAANPAAVLPTIQSRCQQLTLPGTLALAARSASESPMPELGEIVSDDAVPVVAELVRSSLDAALEGQIHDLLRLPYSVPEGLPPFQVVAAVTLQLSVERRGDRVGEGLVRLATELLAVERRTRALNLNARGQMVSSLMRWYREL
jgi:hypothetical protein